jgi:hypothetical protein
MGSRHRSAVTTSMPLTPITLITEVQCDYKRKLKILQPAGPLASLKSAPRDL